MGIFRAGARGRPATVPDRRTRGNRRWPGPILALLFAGFLPTQLLAQGNDLGALCAKGQCQTRQAGISAEAFGADVLAAFARPATSPESRLLLASDGMLYGTTETGGDFDLGALYRVGRDGNNYEVLHSFSGSLGAFPRAALIQDAQGNLCGTAEAGGFSGFGSVFRRAPDGRMSTLHDFDFDDGTGPQAALVLGSDGRLYGTTRGGGANDLGTVFSLPTNATGSQLTTLHSFDGAAGALPGTPLVQAGDGNFYGTTEIGGPDDLGTLFRITPAGAFTSLHAFSSDDASDGEIPSGGLIVGSDGALYGLTYDGGANAEEFFGGTLYRITTDGAFSVVYAFPAKASDGTFPNGELLIGADGNFYGTTQHGGTDFSGTVFRVAQDGSNLQTIVHLTSGLNANPAAGLVQGADGRLFGTAESGGRHFAGSVFAVGTDDSENVLHEFGSASGHLLTGLSAGNGMVFGSTTRGGDDRSGTLFSVSTTGFLNTLHDFGAVGADPNAPPIMGDDGLLYGTTAVGGQFSVGMVYRRESNGNLTELHGFNTDDGAFPQGRLFQAADGSLWGTAIEGGASGAGTVFRIDSQGAFELLHSFDGANGRFPIDAPIEAGDGNFYGTTESGGADDAGVVYRITPAGQFSVLHEFTFATGYFPVAGLVEGGDGLLYGTTSGGGDFAAGTLFRISRAGAHEVLYEFIGPDGENPQAPLLPNGSGGFYGTTQVGGEFELGTVFELKADGTLQTLHEFGGADGAFPQGALAMLGNDLYVAAAHFGAEGGGTVLRLSPDSGPSPPAGGSNGGGGSSGAPGLGLLLGLMLIVARRCGRVPAD